MKITRHIDSNGTVIVVTDRAEDRPKLKRRNFVDMEHRLKRDLNQKYSRFIRSLPPGSYIVSGEGESFEAKELDWNPVFIPVKKWEELVAEIEQRQWRAFAQERWGSSSSLDV